MRAETLAGRICIGVGLFGHQEVLDMGGSVKAMLDELHLRKIDLADEILVLDVPWAWCTHCQKWLEPERSPSGNILEPLYCDSCDMTRGARPYIGDSTRRDIAHATAAGKKVRYLSQETPS